MSSMKLLEENNVTVILVQKLSSNLLLDNDVSSSLAIGLDGLTSSKSLSVVTPRKLSTKRASGNESIFRETKSAASKTRCNSWLARNN